MRKVRIIGIPKKQNGGQGFGNNDSHMGLRRFMEGDRNYDSRLNQYTAPDFEVNSTLQPVDRSEANIEAERGEVAMVPGMGGIPETYTIGGKRHADGGTPLALDKDSFIWSDNKSNKFGMKIKDKDLLKDEFGMSVPNKGKSKGYTPADIAKKYDINKYKQILMDSNSDKLERETAELMIENYNLKLGKLALVQESMKGFPQGPPSMAKGYMDTVGMSPEMFAQGNQPQSPEYPQAQDGAIVPPTKDEITLEWLKANQPATMPKNIDKYLPREGTTSLPRITKDNKLFIPGANNYDLNEYVPMSIPEYQGYPIYDINGKYVVGDHEFNQQYAQPFQRNKNSGDIQIKYGKQDVEFQNGGIYEGAFWNSIMQDGGEGKNKLTLKEMWENTRANRFNRRNPDMEWTPIEQIDPVLEDAIVNDPNITSTTSVTNTPTSTNAHTITADTKPKVSPKSTTIYNVPDKYKDNEAYVEGSASWDPSNIKPGDYVKKADGKFYKATGLQAITADYKGSDLATTFGNNTDVAGAYAYLDKTFQDPEVRKAFADKTRDALRNKEYYKGKRGVYSDMYTEDEIKKLSDDDLVNQFLTHQKRNYSLQANGIDPEDFQDSDGKLRSVDDLTKVMMQRKDANGNLAYDQTSARQEAEARIANYKSKNIGSLNNAFSNVGVPITDEELKAGNLGMQQASYWGYHDLIKDRDKLDPELQSKLKYLTEPQEGYSDEPLNSTISPIDSKNANFYTNTTAGQLAVVEGEEMGYEEADLLEKEQDPLKPGTPNFTPQGDPYAQIWAQDAMNLGNLGLTALTRKKYLPHSYPINTGRPDVVYYDPARAVATNNEQSGMARRANTAFAGPQSTYRNTGIAGQTWARNLDVIGQYDNMNVPIANAYYDKVWQGEREQNIANAQRAQTLFDQNTIANQQMDNTRVADRRNITDARIQALTNAMETQAWNQQFPNYNTQPGIGGGMWRTSYQRPFVNTGMPGQNNSYVAQFQNLKRQYPEASDKAIENQLNMQYGQNQFSPYDEEQKQRAAFAAQYGAINPMPGMYPG